MFVERGEIYNVDFGKTTDSVQGGIRPAIIVQNNKGNTFSPNVIVVPITSKKKPYLPTHVGLNAGEGGLVKNSIALLENPTTISKNCIYGKMGVLSQEAMLKIDIALCISVGVIPDLLFGTVKMLTGNMCTA